MQIVLTISRFIKHAPMHTRPNHLERKVNEKLERKLRHNMNTHFCFIEQHFQGLHMPYSSERRQHAMHSQSSAGAKNNPSPLGPAMNKPAGAAQVYRCTTTLQIYSRAAYRQRCAR